MFMGHPSVPPRVERHAGDAAAAARTCASPIPIPPAPVVSPLPANLPTAPRWARFERGAAQPCGATERIAAVCTLCSCVVEDGTAGEDDESRRMFVEFGKSDPFSRFKVSRCFSFTTKPGCGIRGIQYTSIKYTVHYKCTLTNGFTI